MNALYILVDGAPVECTEPGQWGRWLEEHDRERIVARDTLFDGTVVSTVFLGIDHAFSGGPPVLWETMIFGGPHDQYKERYASRDRAIDGHGRALELAHKIAGATS